MSIINSSVVNMPSRTDSPLQVAIIGAGLGGLAAAVSLRRQGHAVTVYERYDFAGEVGASLSAASNGSRFLEEWGVDVKAAKPVRLSNSLETKYFRSNSIL
jgi:salicylate hydroxylase